MTYCLMSRYLKRAQQCIILTDHMLEK
jgi:hypothetical protein